MTFSENTLAVFWQLINNYSIAASDPNLEEVAKAINTAKIELEQAIKTIKESAD